MTKGEMNALFESVKRCHWDPILGVKMFSKHHPHVPITPEVYGLAIGVGRTPFPNIKGLPEGPFPVYKDRPLYDARLWESDEQRQWEADMRAL